MSRHASLLQQMLELNEAMQRPPASQGAREAALAGDHGKACRQRPEQLRDKPERRSAGASFGAIAHLLNQRGLRGEHGGRWYAATVRNFLLRTQFETH